MLLIYQNNILQGAMGTNNRIIQLLKIFKELGYSVDQFAYEGFSCDSSFENFEEQNKAKLINKAYIYDFTKGYGDGEKEESRIQYFAERVIRKLKRNQGEKKYLQDWVPIAAKRMFNDIISNNDYDVIVCFYTYLATLLEGSDIKAKKVYFMEDSMFLQQYSWDKDNVKGLTLGKLIDEEIERISWFDEVFCISNDEKIMYEKLTQKEMHFLPHLLDKSEIEKKPFDERKWDVYFIGFNNPFNVEGLKWFMNDVYQYLNPDLKIVLVGSATKEIENTHSNVEIIPFAEDLNDIYKDSKIAICPMFRGTGMKIKVVEAMSNGLPVVCNERGVDGLPDKTVCGCLVTQDPKEFAEYINKLASDVEFYDQKENEIKQYFSRVFEKTKYKKMLGELL